MNGAHDMGGMHGFGPIVVEADEPIFHAEWERDVAGTVLALIGSGRMAVDQLRRNIERQPPPQYLSNSYYENWLHSVTAMVLEAGLVTREELASGRVDPAAPEPPPSRWSTQPEPPTDPARYSVGDRVRAKVRSPLAHTREPRYIRGRTGVVAHIYGGEPLPELAGEGVRREEYLYRVRFEAAELWGDEAAERDALYIDLVESYLEPAP